MLRRARKLLSKIDTVSCQQILAIVVNNSQTSGSMTGQEERDNLFARLFGIKAIIQSGLLVKQTPLRTSSAAPTSLQCFELVLSELISLGEKKSWLRESCWWTMLSALETVNSSGVSWKDDAVKLILNRIYAEDKSWSPEKVALTLRFKTMYPSIEWNTYITSPFKGNDVLATSNLLALGRIMKVVVALLLVCSCSLHPFIFTGIECRRNRRSDHVEIPVGLLETAVALCLEYYHGCIASNRWKHHGN